MENILLVEDDQLTGLLVSKLLAKYGHVEWCQKFQIAQLKLQREQYSVVFIDLDLEGPLKGIELITTAKGKNSYTVITTARDEESIILSAYRQGCNDFLVKPTTADALDFVMARYQLMKSLPILLQQLFNRYQTQDPIFINSISKTLLQLDSATPLLITGETGTGKSYLAQIIHQVFYQNHGAYVHLNCAEIPTNLLEAELFGHKKGAFTGANIDYPGKLALAHKGTLFLDEVGVLPVDIQKKLLRVIEEKTFYPLGSNQKVTSDFRLLTATCDDLQALIQQKKFREDLYYRIAGLVVNIIPLRMRKADIGHLIKSWIKQSYRRIIIQDQALQSLVAYDWPGNVRELNFVFKNLLKMQKGIIELDDLPGEISFRWEKQLQIPPEWCQLAMEQGLKNLLVQVEQSIIKSVYQLLGQKVRETVKILQISNNSFYRAIDQERHSNKDEEKDETEKSSEVGPEHDE